MRKYHILGLISLLLAASNLHAADAIPVPPDVKTTQIQRVIPCTIDTGGKKVEGLCPIEFKLEDFGLKNLTINITTPSISVVEPAPTAVIKAVPASAVILATPISIFSTTSVPITVESLRSECGYDATLAARIIQYNQVYTVNERRLIEMYWDWGWYGSACSKIYAARDRFAYYP